MVTYYLYEVPGEKNGATIDWEGRSKYNFRKWGIQPIIIETMEGPDTPEMWKIVGDREWELADANGYRRGDHYLVMRQKSLLGFCGDEKRHVLTKEECVKGGRKGKGKILTESTKRKISKAKETLTMEIALKIRSEYVRGSKNQFNKVGLSQHELAKKYNTTRNIIKRIVNNETYI